MRILLLSLLSITTSIVASAQGPAEVDPAQMIMHLERYWASSTADPEQIARFIEENVTPDYRYTASDGTVMTKAELIERSRRDKAGIATATHMQVFRHGDTAVVIGVWTQGTRHLRFTDTFVRNGGKWLCLAGQTTPIKAEKH